MCITFISCCCWHATASIYSRVWFSCFSVCTSAQAEEQWCVQVLLDIMKSVSTGGDQGVLNSFFNTWATTDISKHLPFIYNLSTVSIYSYLPAFKQSVHACTFQQLCSDTHLFCVTAEFGWGKHIQMWAGDFSNVGEGKRNWAEIFWFWRNSRVSRDAGNMGNIGGVLNEKYC